MALYALNGPNSKIRNGISVNQPPPAGTGGANYIRDSADTQLVQKLSLTDLQGTSMAQRADGAYRDGQWLKDAPAVLAKATDVSAPAAGTAAIVTYGAAGTYLANTIQGVAFGYDSAPTAGLLTVEDGAGNIIFSEPVTNAGPGFFDWPKDAPLRGSNNAAMIITLSSGGDSVKGSITIKNHKVV